MTSTRVLGPEESLDDDVFLDEGARRNLPHPECSNNNTGLDRKPSPTGYPDYRPPSDVFLLDQNGHLQEEIHKTILLGDSGVGKTSLLVRFDTGKFHSGTFSATVGIGFTNKNVSIENGEVVKLQIWDTAGQERFRSITHAYYRDAHALLLLYDVTNKLSFDNIRAWLGEIREYAQNDVVIVLLGNKADCELERKIEREQGERLSREYSVPFMETSAKNGLNVDGAFTTIAKQLRRSKSETHHSTTEPIQSKFRLQDYISSSNDREATNCVCTI